MSKLDDIVSKCDAHEKKYLSPLHRATQLHKEVRHARLAREKKAKKQAENYAAALKAKGK